MNRAKALGGEHVIGRWTATHATHPNGRYPIEGRLWLTPTRLVFVPVFKFLRRFHWSCDLDDVTDLTVRPVEASRLNRSPRPRVAVVTEGRTHFFLVKNPAQVRAAVAAASAEDA